MQGVLRNSPLGDNSGWSKQKPNKFIQTVLTLTDMTFFENCRHKAVVKISSNFFFLSFSGFFFEVCAMEDFMIFLIIYNSVYFRKYRSIVSVVWKM